MLALNERRHCRFRASKFQGLLLAMIQTMLYTYCPFFTGIFLDTTREQFAFSLLPRTMQQRWPLTLLAAVLELWLVLFWVTAGHFGSFCTITFEWTVQTALIKSISALRYGFNYVAHGGCLDPNKCAGRPGMKPCAQEGWIRGADY